MGFTWVILWSVVAVTGAFLLNPVCALLFLLGAILEAAYCRMLLITHLRVLVSGVVKTLGGLAAVFAVDPNPSPLFLALLFLWLFFWEIGGQNVPADLYDLEEDAALRFRTVPVRFGITGAGRIMLVSLYLTLMLNPLLLSATPRPFSLFVAAGCLVAGVGLLLAPAHRFYAVRSDASVSRLFTRASLYPAAVLGVVLIHMLFINLWR
jgi:4-hydroxybenzoate polyprenyltransferase